MNTSSFSLIKTNKPLAHKAGICSLRLDFESFSIGGPDTATNSADPFPVDGGKCTDKFHVTVCTHGRKCDKLQFCKKNYSSFEAIDFLLYLQTPTWQTIPFICGDNAKQHSKTPKQTNINIFFLFPTLPFPFSVFVDIGANDGDMAMLKFMFSSSSPSSSSSSTMRMWDIKVAQLECGSQAA